MVKAASICDAPCVVVVNASGGTTLDANGRYLHLAYSPGSTQMTSPRPSDGNLATSDNAPPMLRFNAAGMIYLPLSGELYWTGGNAADTYDVTLTKIPVHEHKPQMVWLQQYQAGVAVTVPEAHTHLRAATETSDAALLPPLRFFFNVGVAGVLGPVPIGLSSARVVTFRDAGIIETGLLL